MADMNKGNQDSQDKNMKGNVDSSIQQGQKGAKDNKDLGSDIGKSAQGGTSGQDKNLGGVSGSQGSKV